MFYLKELLFIIRDHKTLALTNIMFLALFTGITQFKSDIRDFFSLSSKASSDPYFNALVGSDINAGYLARKMRNLPGVSAVEVKTSLKLEKEVGEFLQDLGGTNDLIGQSYNAFKIVLEKGTRPKSRELIKEYFSRLAGKKEVTFSHIKNPVQHSLKSSPLYSFFAVWSDVYLAALAGLGWLFTLWLMAHPLTAQSFVIERFQRKEKTSLKMYVWLWSLPAFGSLAAVVLLDYKVGVIEFAPGIALLALGSLFFLNKGKTPKRFI